jgi:hypothetical protein
VVGLVLVDASHEDQEMDVPPVAPLVPVLASTGVFRLLGVSFGASCLSTVFADVCAARRTRHHGFTIRASRGSSPLKLFR